MINNTMLWKSYLSLYRPFTFAIIKFLGLSCVVSGIIFMIPLFVKDLIKVVATNNTVLIIYKSCFIFILFTAQTLLNLYIQYIVLHITKSVKYKLCEDIFNKLNILSTSYYQQHRSAKIHTWITQDSLRLDNASNVILTKCISSIIIVLPLFVFLAVLDIALLIIIVVCVIPASMVTLLFRKRLKKKLLAFYASYVEFAKKTMFLVQMRNLIRLQTAEVEEERNKEHVLLSCKKADIAKTWESALFKELQQLLFVGVLGVMALSLILLKSYKWDMGNVFAFFVALRFLIYYIRNIFLSVPHIVNARESWRIIQQILYEEDTEPYHGKQKMDITQRIVAKSLSFRYKEIEIFNKLNFSIALGDSVVIVGGNGTGKSTLFHLLFGLYKPQSGAIYVDEVPYDEIDIYHLRRQISIVPQEAMILPGTIYENIAYGTDASLTLVQKAAQLATAEEFIVNLPQGYETRIGEEGVFLSGGQKQRLSIARALLRKPKVLLLDEPGNYLGKNSLQKILTNISMSDIAVIVITHSEEVAQNFSQIYVLEKGKLERKK